MVLKGLLSFFLVCSSTVIAAEINLETRAFSGSYLYDGDIIATGSVFCDDGEVSRVVLLNIKPVNGSQSNVYHLQGRNKPSNELTVRIEGNGWSPSDKVGNGIYKKLINKQDQFYVVANGRQHVRADIYT
ncbi:hypothetical protein EHZ81_23740, partial [Salmonella enterica]|nr:hypothetical protein [Salmonella enterica]